MELFALTSFLLWISLAVTGVSGITYVRSAVETTPSDEVAGRLLKPKFTRIKVAKLNSPGVGTGQNVPSVLPKLLYYGGPVISNVDIQPLFWPSAAAVADSSRIVKFYKGIANSTLLDWLSEYNQTIGRGRGRDATITLTNRPTKTTLDDVNDIQPYLRRLYKSGVLNPTSNTYYPIHFGPKITITEGGLTSCRGNGFCGYHGTINVGTSSMPKYIFYGVIPHLYTGNCRNGCGNSKVLFNNLCAVASHELLETITDPCVGLGTSLAYPLAWYDPKYGEMADICNIEQGTVTDANGDTWTVQAAWSNLQGKCVVGRPPSPTAQPTVAPTAQPTVAPTAQPTVAPTAVPTAAPTAVPVPV